ncbi:MAG: flagellar biosynthesis protein FliQ [Oscillospiraceae bacterium]|jgi:flagellar biosynthetic protein FliQ|nr:flagellar biosynthesis protein FliQ [Oscillospiraceae bacterium]
MLTQSQVISLIRDGVWTVIVTAAPVLIVAIAIGLIVSIFQATTSINEQTLAFVPKIVAILLSLVIFGAFMLQHIQDYIINLYSQINQYLG